MMEEDLTFATTLEKFKGKDQPNIKVYAEGGFIRVAFNQERVFNTMYSKDMILLALNKKLIELIQKHLGKMSSKELSLKVDESGEQD